MRTRRVLIASMDPLDALDLQQRLTHTGHPVLAIATSREDVLHLAAVLRPDVVVMDLQLPSPMDGLQAGTHIWATLAIPVMYVSAHFPAVTLQRLWPTALVGLLGKGVDAQHLHRAIEVLVARHTPPRLHPPPMAPRPLPAMGSEADASTR
jgi:DNA-binding NarL/FixJ family response regulator